METAREVAAQEPDEGEKVTAAVVKKALKALIDDLKDSAGPSARKELKRLQEQDRIIKAIEKRIRAATLADIRILKKEISYLQKSPLVWRMARGALREILLTMSDSHLQNFMF